MLENCDWNLIFGGIAALGTMIGVFTFFKSGIEKMIQRNTDILHKDITDIKEDLKETKDSIKEIVIEMREESKRTNERFDKINERIDKSYQMFVDVLTGKTSDKPKTDP